MMSSEFP
jgi:serine/threonine protein kinase